MDALAALRLQVEWGADEALEDAPQDRIRPAPPAAAPAPLRRPAVPSPGIAAAHAPHPADACTDLAALAGAIAGFTGCALRETAANTLWLEGDPTHSILVIGDPPVAEDDRAGRIFQGSDAALSLTLLASIGLERGMLALCPLLPWRPPGDRPASAAELSACLPFVQRLIALANPRVLVLAGAQAVKSLGPERRRMRPEFLPSPAAGPPVLVLGGMAALRGSPAGKQAAWAALRALRHHLDGTLAQS
ncbi:MAG: uracil-DNA glycosylase [Rhodospirillales bacterium]|nr:uracil-DNA glycosylase [Rhodospirillales bacterium]